MEHADELPLFSSILKEEYLWSGEYDEEEDEMQYEEEVFPDDLFYSFYYYFYQALLSFKPIILENVIKRHSGIHDFIYVLFIK